jgi:hypothetical protein
MASGAAIAGRRALAAFHLGYPTPSRVCFQTSSLRPAVASVNGTQTLFARGYNKAVYYNQLVNGSFGSWTYLGGEWTSEITAAFIQSGS